MQLEIGGAETHVVELAKELKRNGFIPVITSNGGVYVKELEEAGIKHYTVPLQNKNPLNVINSVRLLKKIIKTENIDIVHSHARIASIILGKLHRIMKFPFVTTAHWVFTTKYGLKYITDWGEKTVAVSDDIKTYLMDNYGIPATDIQVTINGIDTEKFSPDTDCTDIKNEFGVKDSDFVISYVSRMDESRSLVAKQLIEAVPKLIKDIPNLKVLIVGDGDDFNNVKSMTDKVNSDVGSEVISLAGARVDINKFAAVCDLFVGVSRAALEAMAAKKPVIISGNEGYIGLFDESKLQVGIDTNFCCRGCEESTSELIYNDIKRFYALNTEAQNALGEYGRELIKREYSVARMAKDSIKVYDWALAKNKEILVSGYYGFRNSGDDALLNAIIESICEYKESPNFVVLSADAKETMRTNRVKAINRFNIFKIIKHMKKAEMLIFGGGTLIQDGTSSKSLWYYLMIIALAKRYNCKVMLYSNGVGPLNKEMNKKFAAKVLNNVDLITLRDGASYETLREINVTNPNIKVTADPVFDLECADKEYGRQILSSLGIVTDKKLLGVSVRKWSGNARDFEKSVAMACDYAAEKYGFYPVFIPMQHEKDMAISKNIMKLMKNSATVLEKNYCVEDIMSLFACMDLCMGMRLHSLIYAASAAIPVIGISYDPKILSFMEYTHQKFCTDAGTLSADNLKKLIDSCMNEYDAVCAELSEYCIALKQKAKENGAMAVELYEKN